MDLGLNQASFGSCDLYTRPCLVCRDNRLPGTINTSLKQVCETFHSGTSSTVLLVFGLGTNIWMQKLKMLLKLMKDIFKH